MFSHADGRKFPIGLGSPLGRRSIFFDGDKPEPIGLLDPVDTKTVTADELKKAAADVTAKANEIAKLVNPTREDVVKLQAMMGDFSKKMDNLDAIVKAGGRNNSLIGDGSIAINRAGITLDVPEDVTCNRTYFNLVAKSPAELIGLSHLAPPAAAGSLEDRTQSWLREGKRETYALLQDFQRLNDGIVICDAIMYGGGNTNYARSHNTRWDALRSLKLWPEYERVGKEIQRALNEGTGNQGLDWVPTILSANLIDIVQANLKVAALFPQLTMTSQTLINPVLGGDVTAYLQAEGITDGTAITGPPAAPVPASQMITNKVTFSAVKMGVRTYASSEVLEDAVLALLPLITANLAKVFGRSIEDAIVNGDAATTFMDGTTYNPAGGIRRAWNGLRQQVWETSNPATVSASNAAITDTMALTVLMKQGIHGAVVGEGAWLVGFKGWANLLKNPAMITLEKYGAAATILSGEVGKYFGRPVILTEFLTDNYNASGVYDGTTVDRGEVLHVYRSGYGLAQRRAVTIKASQEPITMDQTVVVGTYRGDFKPFFPASATVAPVGAIYNVGGP